MRRAFFSLSALAISLAGALPAQELTLVHYGADIALRDHLIRQECVFADLGSRVVVRLDAAAVAALRDRGVVVRGFRSPEPREHLIAFFARRADEQPVGVRVLLRDANLYLIAGKATTRERLHRPGIVHGGVIEVDLSRPYVATPAVDHRLPLGPDPKVQALVNQVQQANLVKDLTALTSIYTRNARSADNAKAISYVKSELAKLGRVTVKTESFSSTYGPNVIAELPGYGTGNEIIMVGAHLDSYVRSSGRSPGADDNGSGSAAVLEIARILSAAPLQKTVRFGWWNAEEYGLIGSRAYASAARSRGDKIVAYINLDMIAYRRSGDTVDADWILNNSTQSLMNTLIQISKTYVPTLAIKTGYLSGGTSDQQAFFQNGFPAAWPFEDLDAYSPYIHSSNDDMVNSTNDMNLATMITQSVVAGLATLAMPLPEPSFSLSVSKGPSVGGTQVTATGTFLDAADSVKVAGKSVAFQVQNGAVTLETPTVALLGPATVEIGNPGGVGKATFAYEKTSPPALRVSAQLQPGDKGVLAVGAEPQHVAVTLYSGSRGTTDVGLLKLDIGSGNPLLLYLFHVGVLASSGGTHEVGFQLPTDPGLRGVSVHFQSAILEPSLASVAKTNVGTLAIQ